jgi:N-acetyl-anhydromuramoyl-L-alanine amidase
MSYRELFLLSPNHATAPAHERRGVCFHHSVMDFESTIAHMRNPASQVSYHLLIAPDGTRARLVADEHIAWHAGVSVFQGRPRCNDFLLGVSFAGDTYAAPLTAHQLASVLDWLAPRWLRHGWTAAAMTDHRQIAPGRKNDLAPAEWNRLITAISARFPVVV